MFWSLEVIFEVVLASILCNVFTWFGERENGEISTACGREAFFQRICSSKIDENRREIDAESRSVFVISFGEIFFDFGAILGAKFAPKWLHKSLVFLFDFWIALGA